MPSPISNFASSLIPSTANGAGHALYNNAYSSANNRISNVAAGAQMNESIGSIGGNVHDQENYMTQLTKLGNELALKNAQCNIEKKLGEAAKSLSQ